MFSWARVLRPAGALLLALACSAGAFAEGDPQGQARKLGKTLAHRAADGSGASRVIVTFNPGMDASADAKQLGARLGRQLRSGRVMSVPDSQLQKLASHPAVRRIRLDRPVSGLPLDESAARKAVRNAADEGLGFTGRGVGVAIIDSGITSWNDELTYSGSSARVMTKAGQRVAAFVDYVTCEPTPADPCFRPPYDDYGHGTHVAGVIAGNGLGASGFRKGSAPEAHLVVLKVLDGTGRGHISDVVDALEFAVQHKTAYNIRIVNMSIAAKPADPDDGDDDLAEATKAATDAGIIVVAAAGNFGWNREKNAAQYGGITAPGTFPWVVTVGAYSQEGTPQRRDDIVAPFSSRGPTAYTFLAKPDLLAPGTSIVSIGDSTSQIHRREERAGDLVDGRYTSLSGTSVAAPAVAGLVAVMLQANPTLTPNLAKAILQYTATPDPRYDALTQGAGWMNPNGAVTLSRYFARAVAGDPYPIGKNWGRRIIWGNYLMRGGLIWPNASAWATDVVWGTMVDEEGDNIVWGTLCDGQDCDNIVWGTFEDEDNIVWGTSDDGDNIVWGTACGEAAGADGDQDCDNIVWGTRDDDDNIVWGTCADQDCDNIVWGTLEDVDNIVWGTDCSGDDCDNIVWGTNVAGFVWGTAEDDDNIVWGTGCDGQQPEDCDNIVWGSDWEQDSDNIVWGTSALTAAPPPPAVPSAANRTKNRKP